MAWTDERVELLKKLWSDGLSASQIAAQLGDGVTRNAVIGKVHRLNLAGRAKPASTGPRQRKPRTTPQRPAPTRHFTAGNAALKTQAQPVARRMPQPAAMRDVVVPISMNVSLLQLTEAMCKWPSGDPGTDDFHFCGHRSSEAKPYCEYHSRVAYQPVERRRDRRRQGG